MTEGDKRWIENWQPKGVDMKESKKYANKGGSYPLVGKLLKLKYRINDAYRSGKFDNAYNDTQVDKTWVMDLINDVRNSNLTKLCKEDILHCNGLWRKYEQVL